MQLIPTYVSQYSQWQSPLMPWIKDIMSIIQLTIHIFSCPCSSPFIILPCANPLTIKDLCLKNLHLNQIIYLFHHVTIRETYMLQSSTEKATINMSIKHSRTDLKTTTIRLSTLWKDRIHHSIQEPFQDWNIIIPHLKNMFISLFSKWLNFQKLTENLVQQIAWKRKKF